MSMCTHVPQREKQTCYNDLIIELGPTLWLNEQYFTLVSSKYIKLIPLIARDISLCNLHLVRKTTISFYFNVFFSYFAPPYLFYPKTALAISKTYTFKFV